MFPFCSEQAGDGKQQPQAKVEQVLAHRGAAKPGPLLRGMIWKLACDIRPGSDS
jgi:hypothetical protein